MQSKGVPLISALKQALEELPSLTTVELLNIKRVLSNVNATIINRISKRLTQLLEVRIGEPVTIHWDDISFWPGSSDVLVCGLRVFEVGDTVDDEEGGVIDITEANVDAIAQKIRLMLTTHVLSMLEDTSISIDEIANELNAPTMSNHDPAEQLERERVPAERAHPLEEDPLAQHLYTVHNKSTTRH